MRTTAVRLASEPSRYETRPWKFPLVVACCPSCAYRGVAVSNEASDAALWEHTAAVHMGGIDAKISRTEAED